MRQRIGARSCEDAKVTTPINHSARRKYTTPREPPRNLFLARVAKPNRTISVTNLSLCHPVACLTYSVNCRQSCRAQSTKAISNAHLENQIDLSDIVSLHLVLFVVWPVALSEFDTEHWLATRVREKTAERPPLRYT